MSLIKLSSLATRLTRRNLLQGFIMSSQNERTFKTDKDLTVKKADDDDDDEKPIQYSTSPAAVWAAEYSQSGGKNESPNCEPVIATISFGIFLLYFLVFREPNDIDQKFEMQLSDHVKHIDVESLKRTARIPMYTEEKKSTK